MKQLRHIVIFTLTILLSTSVLYAKNNRDKKEKTHVGTVLEATSAGNYMYLKIDENDKEVWLATQPKYLKVKVVEGDKVEYLGGAMMKDFKSKALDRTFESILFISRVKVLKKDADTMPADDYHKQVDTKKIDATPYKEPVAGEVSKAKDGMTIGDIFEKKDTLNDLVVVLNGKVMKVSKNILKKNWITLTDGTGTEPDNKIIALTTDTAEINDIVTVKGTVKINVDLGSGYKYKLLINDAAIISQ